MSQVLPPGLPKSSIPLGCVVKTSQFPIGQGSFANVYKGDYHHPYSRHVIPVAIKVLVNAHLPGGEKSLIRLRREAWAWVQLSHPNVAPFLGLAQVHGLASDGLITDWAEYGNLHQHLKEQEYTKEWLCHFVRGIAGGLAHLHSRNVVHGDLKPDNVLVRKGMHGPYVQLTDFGLARIIDFRGYTTHTLGHCRYRAVELMHLSDESENDTVDGQYSLTNQCDVWSFAMLSLEVLSGKLPFCHFPTTKLARLLLQLQAALKIGDRPHREDHSALTTWCWDILCICWEGDPSRRPDMDRVVAWMNSASNPPLL
ncbi:hypothetical protein JAAARDRAFT_57825 [Jaapia argillacea MUCL 33604]|uniref:Protein kinase domain-containing protein n=1 Tax=Jaapia argillacea MUCL 33604 TaxID=933084 RepID=A0A067Q3H4_9AGAM|nr:hypothetical protein JAAARDRAFT_57825 [Jaapia argillacea MUCL 33604]